MATCTCGEPEEIAPGDAAAGDPDPGTCPRTPKAADRTRYVVAGHRNDQANDSRIFELYALSQSGILSFTGTTFMLGNRAQLGSEIVFTPDGEIGIVALDNLPNTNNGGTLGVFRIDDAGNVTVIHEAFAGGAFYASRVVMGPRGRYAYVIEGNVQTIGGGVYVVSIGCDGTLVDEGIAVAANLPDGLVFSPTDPAKAVLAAIELNPVSGGSDAYLFDWPPLVAGLAGADLFAENQQNVADLTITVDGRYVLASDDSAFNGVPDRIGVAEIVGNNLIALDALWSPHQAPGSVFASPFNNSFLLATAGGSGEDSYTWFSYDPTDSVTPFVFADEVTYQGGVPLLPGVGVMIERGGLSGRMLFGELSSIRQLQFLDDGAVADAGTFDTGNGIEFMVDALGVQP